MKLSPAHRLALSRWLVVFTLPILSIISLTAESHAQDDAPSSTDIKRAADSYDIGRERFRDGDFTEAAERFEAADSYAPSAAALRLAIASRKEAGQMARAATLAALALERYPDETDLRSEAEAILGDAGRELAKLNVNCDVACELTLNNRLVHGSGAQSRTLYVDPGKVTLRATWSEGRTQSERLKLDVGDFKEVSFYAPPLSDIAVDGAPETEPTQEDQPAETPTEEKASKGWSPAVFWTGAALTVGGVGASVALGVRALNHPGKDAVLENCAPGDQKCPEYVEGRQNQMVANVAIGATAAVGVFTMITGIWLTNWGGKQQEAHALHEPAKGAGLRVRPLVAVG
ncbi:MAG TPA: hypothetical protein VN764_11715, partial [Polyangiaceae bacterium]|nr:hypothetical protein [Polyangiaceae bacterium]